MGSGHIAPLCLSVVVNAWERGPPIRPPRALLSTEGGTPMRTKLNCLGDEQPGGHRPCLDKAKVSSQILLTIRGWNPRGC